MLRPGDACTLSFTFNPEAPGSVNTEGSVGPALGPAIKFTLGGSGSSGSPTLTLSPATVDFKTVDVGVASSAAFTVTYLAGFRVEDDPRERNPATSLRLSRDYGLGCGLDFSGATCDDAAPCVSNTLPCR
jgi:hypothetical protein